MRYFISFWVVLATLFIFSDTLQAADVVEQVEKQSISTPIEPIEPKARTKGNFWQKTRQKLQLLRSTSEIGTEVTPIAAAWYKLVGVFMGLIGGGLGIFGLSHLLTALFGAEWLSLMFALSAFIGMIIFIFYAVKLFEATKGEERNFLKGKRFLFGYICSFLLFALVLLSGLALATLSFGTSPVFELGIFLGYLIAAIIIGGLVLLFNIIDQRRYKKYLQEQNQQQ